MQGLEEDASKVEVRNGDASDHRTEQMNACSQHVDRSRRQHRRQGAQWLLRDTSSGSSSSGGGSSYSGSYWSSHQSTMMRGSRDGNWAGRAGRGLRMKVNLPIFKDEKTKDAVPYHLWRWEIAFFCHLGWDDECLLPYVFHSLQGFLGDLTRSLCKDAMLTNILQCWMSTMAWWWHLTPLVKSSLPSGKVLGRMWLSSECIPVGVAGKDWTGACGGGEWDHFFKGLKPQISAHAGPQSGWWTPH